MSKVAAAITSPATKATKQENSTMSRSSTRIRASSFTSSVRAVWHPQKHGPCSPELKNHENWQSVPISPRPRAALLYPNLCVVVLRGFEECAWDSAHCAETLAISAASNDQCEQFNHADS
jgi:hypothetical protein